jgi:hypothetical protein
MVGDDRRFAWLAPAGDENIAHVSPKLGGHDDHDGVPCAYLFDPYRSYLHDRKNRGAEGRVNLFVANSDSIREIRRGSGLGGFSAARALR